MRVVADTHALIWYLRDEEALSEAAGAALDEAAETDGIIVSAAVLIDLWYVTKTTRFFGAADLARVEAELSEPNASLLFAPIDRGVFDAWRTIDREALADPWDRLIVATALAYEAPVATRDRRIRASSLVETIW